MSKTINYEVEKGASIDWCCKQAMLLADQEHTTVNFYFKGIPAFACPGEHWEAIRKRWEETIGPPPTAEFKPGMIVRHKLTQERMMLAHIETEYRLVGFTSIQVEHFFCRCADLSLRNFYEDELEPDEEVQP